MKFISASRPVASNGRQYHVMVKHGEISRYVLLPGDPGRVLKIASFLKDAKIIAEHREYLTITGYYKDVKVSATSTGIGCPATAIAIEELAAAGANTFIRVGSTGAIRSEILCGDLVITTAAIRLEGTSKQYIMPEYPAHANYEVLLALIEASERLNVRYHVGITATTDSFYCGQGRPGFNNYWQNWMNDIIPTLMKANVLNFEMEASTIFTLASLYELRAGAICAVFANRLRNEMIIKGENECIRVALEAVKILSEWDNIKTRKGKKHLYLSLIHTNK